MSTERCPVCDRDDCQACAHAFGGRIVSTEIAHQQRQECRRNRVDWRARALKAEEERDDAMRGHAHSLALADMMSLSGPERSAADHLRTEYPEHADRLLAGYQGDDDE